MTMDVNCPYCGWGQEINHDDGYGYSEDEKFEQECLNCANTFVFDTSIHYYHEAYKAPCLNGGEHDFRPTRTYPVECVKMECSYCDERRQPTEEEWVVIRNNREKGRKRNDV